jgi:hypothetical protein
MSHGPMFIIRIVLWIVIFGGCWYGVNYYWGNAAYDREIGNSGYEDILRLTKRSPSMKAVVAKAVAIEGKVSWRDYHRFFDMEYQTELMEYLKK